MEGDDGEPEVKLASGPSTAFMWEVVKVKGKRMTGGVNPLQTGQEGNGKEAIAPNCSLGKAHTCATAASPPIVSAILKQDSSNPA